MPIRKTTKTLIWTIAILIIVSNWAGFKNLSGLNDWYYMYSNYGGSYTMVEEPVLGIVANKKKEDKVLIIHIDTFLMPSVPKNDSTVYRLFSMKPYKFWRWGEYAFNWRYKQPYMNWDSVVQRRGFGKIKGVQGGMDF